METGVFDMRLVGWVLVMVFVVGCGGEEAKVVAKPRALEFAGLMALEPREEGARRAFGKAVEKLRAGDDHAFNEVGALAFRLDTVAALTYVAENGSDKQARLAFSGFRAAIDGTASAGFVSSMGPGFDAKRYRAELVDVLKMPENLRRLTGGFERLGAPGKEAFGMVMEAVK